MLDSNGFTRPQYETIVVDLTAKWVREARQSCFQSKGRPAVSSSEGQALDNVI